MNITIQNMYCPKCGNKINTDNKPIKIGTGNYKKPSCLNCEKNKKEEKDKRD